ncbi:MCE family protein [Nocardioides caeni]|uniref:MCE family protein n=1 Tax=Nocardioides caeni TaxID=574700 RepID=A0A4S8N0V9_9ACTN|nr:MlaD family protein [Nocardioides caeni]THV09132.1 MCE family protein [Nocardioides caeni]
MISRRTKIHTVVFVALASSGVCYVGAKYAGLEGLVRDTSYTVSMELADSGGIFTNAEVTYQGVTVGRVGELRPTDEGVTVDLVIDNDAEEIPADGLRADVKNLSIIGEPYVDLTAPTGADGPALAEGSVIEASQTTTPVAPAVLLSGLNGLLDSVPQDSLSMVLDELDTAFSGTGPDLARLLDNTSVLVESANDVLPETIRLIRDGATVLRTQNDSSNSIRSFSKDLRALAGELESSDPDLRRVISAGPTLAEQALALLEESGPGLGQLVADLLTTGRLAEPRNAALRQLLIAYPMLARATYSAVPGDGTVHFGLVLNAFDPLPCTRGYETTVRRPGTDTTDVPVNPAATCAEPRGSAIAVRGSQNAPRAGVPSAAEATAGGASASAQPRISPELLTELQRLMSQAAPLLVTDPVQILEAR